MFPVKTTVRASATVSINTLVQAKIADGERIINLAAGEPIINTNEYIIPKVEWAIKKGYTKYPPVLGLDELRKASAAWVNYSYGSHFTKSNTLVTCGAKYAICLVLQALLQKGDEVMIISPYWVSYPQIVKLFGGKPVIAEACEESGWKVSAKQISESFTPKTKVLIINNATNPTGALYTKEEIKEILAVAKKHNVFVLSDEAYSGLVYDGAKFVSCGAFPEFSDTCAVVQSCSKNFAMTGWRVGFLFGPEWLIKPAGDIQSQTITGTSTVSQWAALAAIQNAGKIIKEVKATLERRRNFFIKRFNEKFNANLTAPSSAIYAWIPLKAFGKKYKDDVKFCERVLDKFNVALVPGSVFGVKGYVRASFGVPENQIDKALHNLSAVRG